MRRVFPPPAEAVSIAEAYAVERPAPAGRPWVGVCMVASLDGSSVVDGRSGALGNANDTTVLATLRQLADVVIVGAGTVRAEGYGAPKKPGLRIGVVTNTGAVDASSRLFTSGAGFFVVPEGVDTPEGVDVVRAGHGRVDLPLALERLEQIVAGVRYVQAEGGPRLNGSLAEHDLIDELDLTISPRVVGGAGSRVVAGATDLDARFELAHLLVDDESFVFSRWVRRRAC
ncbi:MAG TPA: dihydrofolate reductase family protein [Ilumatobacteraceae bacterium]